ncbi:hypothetical protein DUNSADRAFT_3058 [Dunaliella salina]|uniref:Peptidase M48 domain-containing protein n=1 Tax=Dunaliella salina TaxID=3046 RepID=A0ABQ7GUP8_DUNSA|nr:hypothetical protein DUNSADRAFT_3058 [Dunaliella salina]|eukprot:KAF5838326.1 hypothetical protein DUNSADRAFT_3058 [Dunaliella salina]
MLTAHILQKVPTAGPAVRQGRGSKHGVAAIVSLFLFLLVVSPVDEVLSFVLNVVSRAFEFQADAFAAGLGYGKELRAALLRLSKENKGALHVDPWFSAMHYSHPPLVQRLGAIDANTDQKKRL